jgi:GT2 family glycosyltransferase
MNTISETPQVTLIIPTHNRVAQLVRCLHSLRALHYPNYEVIVVDDGSSDATEEVIHRDHPEVHLLRGDGDLWWSRATNLGIRAALRQDAKYVLLLNDDNVVDPDMLTMLVAASGANGPAVVGSVVYRLDRPAEPCFAGGRLDWWRGGSVLMELGILDHQQVGQPFEADWLPGMGTLIPCQAFEKVGFMDDHGFPQYSADADFTLRARRSGYRVLIEPGSKLWNDLTTSGLPLPNSRSATIGFVWRTLFDRRSYVNISTRARFYRRHCPRLYLWLGLIAFYALHLVSVTRKTIVGIVKR